MRRSGKLPAEAWRRSIIIFFTTVLATSCAAPTSPMGPTPPVDVVTRVALSCPASLLISQKGRCVAVAYLASGDTRDISETSTWSSTNANAVVVESDGALIGNAAGNADISVSYRSFQSAASVSVLFVDAVRVTAKASQGALVPGNTVTLFLQGYASIVSAEGGELRLRISDQDGPVTASAPTAVTTGGMPFLLRTTFVIPATSTQLCRLAVLTVGAVEFSAPVESGGFYCDSVAAPR